MATFKKNQDYLLSDVLIGSLCGRKKKLIVTENIFKTK